MREREKRSGGSLAAIKLKNDSVITRSAELRTCSLCVFEIVLEFGSHLNRTTTFNWKKGEANQRLPNLMDFRGKVRGELRKSPRRDALLRMNANV